MVKVYLYDKYFLDYADIIPGLLKTVILIWLLNACKT